MATRPIQYKIPARQTPHPAYDFPKGFAGGMNIYESPDMIEPNQTPDVLNMTLDGGSWSKRFGFKRLNALSWGATPVRGMVSYTPTGGTEKLVVAWGGKLWSVSTVDGTQTSLMTGTKTSIADTQCVFFVMGGKLYCLNGTDYVVYDGTNPVADVVGYVPKITATRNPDGSGGTANEKLNFLSNSWRDVFLGTSTATQYKLSYSGLSATLVKAWVNGVLKTETTDFTVDRPNGTVTFGVAPGVTEVIIQAEKAGLNDPTVITKCTNLTVYGGRNDTRVFFSGSDKNTCYRSGLLDPTYWPIDAYEKIGSDSEAHTGFGRMIDYQINFKEKSIWYSTIDSSSSTITFPVYPLNDEYGCIAPRTIQPVQNGLLALSAKGVIWVSPSLVRSQLNVKIVSFNVNGKNSVAPGILDNTTADLQAAHAYFYDWKYWLHIKDKVWILDLRYSDLAQGVYCWYPYDTVPGLANCFLEKDNTLYIGGNTGVVFTEQRTDQQYQYLDDGLGIDAYWTSPALFLGGRDWEKKFEHMTMTFRPGPCTNHTLTLISDIGQEDISLPQEQGNFNFNFFNFGCFTFGTANTVFPKPQREKVGYKGVYLQFKLRNNDYNRNLVIDAIDITFSMRKIVK